MKTWLRAAGITALIATIPFSTASSVLASQTPQTKDMNSLGTSESNEERSSNLSAEAHAAERGEASNLLSVTWSIENKGDSEVFFNWPSGTSYLYSDRMHYSGVTIKSSDGANRYHPVMDENGSCLCSGKISIDFKEKIYPGEQVAYWSMFSVPDDVESIDLEIPGFDPIEDIPIS